MDESITCSSCEWERGAFTFIAYAGLAAWGYAGLATLVYAGLAAWG